jgi:UDP-GlcNAc3NAcA epimerase
MMKIITVIGARPQFIKAAALSREIKLWNQYNLSNNIDEKIIHTGQHYDQNMSSVFFDELNIPKPYLNLKIGSGGHAQQTGEMLSALEKVYHRESPDAIVVYGDTNSTLAATLTASKLRIPVVHVESGLRSYSKEMPEEQNRILTDHLSTILCCPTQAAMMNLQKEGFDINESRAAEEVTIDNPRVCFTGDVMYDCILHYGKTEKNKIDDSLFRVLGITNIKKTPFILLTIHRAENTDNYNKLKNILSAFSIISKKIKIVLPLHPRTGKIIKQSEELSLLAESLFIIKPVTYLEMISLEKHSMLICTDSGGVQKEAYFLRTPCITLRDQTEWIETVELGWNKVIGTDMKDIVTTVNILLKRLFSGTPDNTPFHSSKKNLGNYYGDGYASRKIIDCLKLIK